MASITVSPLPAHKLKGAYDAGAASMSPRERLRNDDEGFPMINEKHGHELTERVRRAPSDKWVTWSGDVIFVRVAASGQRRGEQPAREQQLKERLHAGKAIRYGICPLRDALSMRWIPAKMRKEQPCAPNTYGEAKCCKHVEQVIAERKAMHNRLEEKRAAKYKNQLVETQKQNQELTKALLSKLGSAKPTTVEGE